MTPTLRRILGKSVLLGLAGAVLLLCLLQSEYLLMPKWLDVAGRLLYRTAFFIVLPFRLIVSFIIPRVDHHWPLSHYVVAALGTPFFLVLMVRGAKKVRWGIRQIGALSKLRGRGKLIDRRQFLIRSAAGVLGVATSGVGTYASLIAPERLRITHYGVPIKGLPHHLEGLRIIHVSDTHYGPYTSLTFLEEVVKQANALNGDIILLTGDYVLYTPLAIEEGIQLLGSLRSRFGAVAVLGNHDHWEGAAACRTAFKRINLSLIDNGRVYITPSGITDRPYKSRSLCVAGVGDLWEDEASFAKALGDVPESVPRVVLSHNPDIAEHVDPCHRVDLIFSGHTHGGQVCLPGMGAPVKPSAFGNKYLGGLCWGPRCPVIVSRGVGLAGIPVRFRVPPEIGLVVLKNA